MPAKPTFRGQSICQARWNWKSGVSTISRANAAVLKRCSLFRTTCGRELRDA